MNNTQVEKLKFRNPTFLLLLILVVFSQITLSAQKMYNMDSSTSPQLNVSSEQASHHSQKMSNHNKDSMMEDCCHMNSDCSMLGCVAVIIFSNVLHNSLIIEHYPILEPSINIFHHINNSLYRPPILA